MPIPLGDGQPIHSTCLTKIPVVQFNDEVSALKLGSVDPDDPSADYIAFSHVWADGLGSNAETGLPHCQISRLNHLASRRLKFGRWFWIDGLCVPSREPLRGIAIEMMKATYQNSTGVIVLDSGLRSLSMSATILEIGWSVFASGWAGRLWTYQEGFLPPWVDLELADGLLDLYTLVQQLYRSSFDFSAGPFPNAFICDLMAVLQKLRPLNRKAKARPKARKIVDIFNAFTRRSTSRPDDQLLVISLLLDVDVREIMWKVGEDRWINFYISLKEIPWTIMFDRRPKIKAYPFRWAPVSWISAGRDVWLRYNEALATISDEGLKVKLTVLALKRAHQTNMNMLVLEVDQLRYELTRPKESSCTNMDTFDLLFIRHLEHESPHKNLEGNKYLLMSVGLGLLANSNDSPLQYDFSSGWEIHCVTEEPDEVSAEIESVEAFWAMKEVCFT